MSRAAATSLADISPQSSGNDTRSPAPVVADVDTGALGSAEARSSVEPDEDQFLPRAPGRYLCLVPSWLVSLILHLVVLIVLALWSLPASPHGSAAIIEMKETAPGLEDAEQVSLAGMAMTDVGRSERLQVDPLQESTPKVDVYAGLDRSSTSDNAAKNNEQLPSLIDPAVLFSDALPTGGGLAGRSAEARGQLAIDGGGTPQSEEAVERGLRWLAAHQLEDGSWHFDHRAVCQQCRHTGSEASTTGATALALLPFLGAGYTHQRDSEHREVVEKGLYYLGSRMLVTPHGGDLREGTMYAQGIATIALCEAYAMTGDQALRPYAESAIKFVQYAQDKKGGGWRYTPGQPGDTTVLGWQLMGLKSGILANLEVRSSGFSLAEHFLNGVQTNSGAGYGYQTPKREATTTAVGLLCRMYTGWRRDHTPLGRGVEFLGKLGPSKDNMYFNYYATQVLHHYDGPTWYQWNHKMREQLIATQATRGHESGSWYFGGGHAETGGRLYNTAMAVMTLEVYYRYMPLYGTEAVEAY